MKKLDGKSLNLDKMDLKEKIRSNSFTKFINNRKYIAGVCFILFFIFSESIPLGAKIADVPTNFTVQFFLMPFPFLKDLSMIYLLIPSSFFLFIAVLPIFERELRLDPLPYAKILYPLLLAAGFSFYPLIYLFKASHFATYLWSILIVSWIGINLWIRSLNYFYSSAISAFLWDLGAAVLAFFQGIPKIGVPYHSGLSPIVIIFIDLALAATFSFLWWKRMDFGKRFGWEWLEAYE